MVRTVDAGTPAIAAQSAANIDGALRCRACHEWLERGEFYKDAHSPTGFTSECRVCRCSRQRRQYAGDATYAEYHRQKAAERYRAGYRSPMDGPPRVRRIERSEATPQPVGQGNGTTP